jgi:hypothetical protein
MGALALALARQTHHISPKICATLLFFSLPMLHGIAPFDRWLRFELHLRSAIWSSVRTISLAALPWLAHGDILPIGNFALALAILHGALYLRRIMADGDSVRSRSGTALASIGAAHIIALRFNCATLALTSLLLQLVLIRKAIRSEAAGC